MCACLDTSRLATLAEPSTRHGTTKQKKNICRYTKVPFLLSEKERLRSKGFAFLHPTRKYSRPCALARSLHGLLIFSLVALPSSAPGGGRAPSPRLRRSSSNPSMQKKKTPDGVFFFWRRRRDLNSRAGYPDLHPEQGRLFGLLSTSPYSCERPLHNSQALLYLIFRSLSRPF